jgi:hypothetical protein
MSYNLTQRYGLGPTKCVSRQLNSHRVYSAAICLSTVVVLGGSPPFCVYGRNHPRIRTRQGGARHFSCQHGRTRDATRVGGLGAALRVRAGDGTREGDDVKLAERVCLTCGLIYEASRPHCPRCAVLPTGDKSTVIADPVRAIDAAYERAAREVEAVHDESKEWQDRHLLRTAAARIRALKASS